MIMIALCIIIACINYINCMKAYTNMEKRYKILKKRCSNFKSWSLGADNRVKPLAVFVLDTIWLVQRSIWGICLLPSPPKGRARVLFLGRYSVCVSVCVCVCLSVLPGRYLKNCRFDLVEIFLWGRVSAWLGPPLKLCQSRENFFYYDFFKFKRLGYIGMYGKHRICIYDEWPDVWCCMTITG